MARRLSCGKVALLILALSIGTTAEAHPMTNNDTNGDGYVDRLHVKTDAVELWNEKSEAGFRVVGLTIASIDPHWNQKTYGIDSVRVLPDRENAKRAMNALGYPGLGGTDNPVYPENLFSSFFLLTNDTSASIYQVTPTSSGSTNIAWARALLQLLSVSTIGNPSVRTLSTFFNNNYVNAAGGSGISSINGGSNNYAYNNSRFPTYNDWMNAPNLSLPPSVSARLAHTDAYKAVGVAHEYQYREVTWAHGAKKPVQAAAQVQYCTGGAVTYCYTTPAVYLGFYAEAY